MARDTSTGVATPHQAQGLDQALLAGREAFLGFLSKRLGNRADAEDVLQEFSLRVLARKDQLRDAGRMDAWLYAILRSTLNDFYRRAGRRERLNDAYAHEAGRPDVAPDVAETLAGQVCSCVETLVPRLRERDAELIRRIDLQEESRKKVAAELGLSSGALAVRLHRARAALRDQLTAFCGYCCRDGFDDCACPSSQGRSPDDDGSRSCG